MSCWGLKPMEYVERGRVRGGTIVLDQALGLPDGTEVIVRIQEADVRGDSQPSEEDFRSLPFFGMWAGREDLSDGEDWVRKQREQWHRRSNREN